MKPKVGIFSRPIDQRTSGSGSHLLRIVRKLLELNRDFEIVLLHYQNCDLDIYRHTPHLLLPRNPLQGSGQLATHRFRVLHYTPLTIFSPLWVPHTRKVATIHGSSSYHLPSYVGKVKYYHDTKITPLYARRMDFIFTVTQASRQFIARTYNIPFEKIVLTPNAVEDNYRVLADKDRIAEDLRRTYALQPPFILHISRFSERKNPWVLLKAFKHLKTMEGLASLRLVIIGSGWNNEPVRAFIRSNDLENAILLTGFIPDEEVVKWLNMAEVFVFPSLYEGFGIPNLEAMACGCPVVTTNIPAVAEVVRDAGLFLTDAHDDQQLADLVARILLNPQLKEDLSRRGRQRARAFSWSQSAQTILDTYTRCLEL
ncbi:MAG: glycosyltransferase family 4 protein [Fidelibacterota bacterium]